MRGRTLHLVLAIALVLLAQGAARAAPLQWEGTLSIELLLGNPSFHAEGGGVASVNASSGGLPAHLETLRLAASRQKDFGIAETGQVAQGPPLTVTASLEPRSFSAISGGAASTGSIGGRELPLRGVFRFGMVAPPTAHSPPLPTTAPLTWLTPNGATAGVGVGGGYLSQKTYTVLIITTSWGHYPGSTTVPFHGTAVVDEIRWVSIQGAPWTIKTVTASAVDPPIFGWWTDDPPPPIVTGTWRGFAHAPASTTTSTAQPGGVLQLVTPMQVRVDHWTFRYGPDRRRGWAAGGFGVLTLRFIPEPGVGLLLATGIAGLVVIGRRRMRE